MISVSMVARPSERLCIILEKSYKISRQCLHMPTTVEIKGILEEKLDMLIKAGLYTSKSEIVRDGLRHLLESIDFLSIALHLYKNGVLSTGKAAEIAGLSVAEFIKECQKRGIQLSIGLEDVNELDQELALLRQK